MRIVRYIGQHHIGLIALFIALTGTAYAGTQLASGPAHPLAQQAKKKKKKVKLIPGPQGLAGPQGPPGPPGTARAYAHVRYGELVAADTTGVAAMTLACRYPDPCTGVPAPGSRSGYVYCFRLGFVPRSVQITPDKGQTNPQAGDAADNWGAQVPARAGASSSYDGCPPGYLDAAVQASVGNSTTELVTGLYITFN